MSQYNQPGWKIKPEEFKKFTLVTPENRKRVVIIGRILYAIEHSGTIMNYNGSFVIRPRLKEGWFKMEGHPFIKDINLYIAEEESREDWSRGFDTVISYLIDKKQLYFKLNDKLVDFNKD